MNYNFLITFDKPKKTDSPIKKCPILNSLISRSYDAQRYKDYKKLGEMGLSYGSPYGNLAAMINGEMGDDDTGTVRLIKDHLKKIGVNANYRFDTKTKGYTENSFTIK